MALPITIMAEGQFVVITVESRGLDSASIAEKGPKMPFRDAIGAVNVSVAR
jgi:hypothetical protein